MSSTVGNEKQQEDIMLALIYTILTDAEKANKAYSDLIILDGSSFATNNLAILVAEKYPKFNEIPRRQLLWFLNELIKNQVNVQETSNIVWNILRQASGGDISQKNISLVEGLLDILVEHRSWLEKDPFLVGTVVYTYTR